MKNYDYNKARREIKNAENLQEASLGMHEDWWWTANTIWEDGEYVKKLPNNATTKRLIEECREDRKNGMSLLSDEYDEKYGKILIGGLYGSGWATPTLQLVFKDGKERMIPCYFGESSGERPAVLHGVLSGPAQERVQELEEE